RIEGAALLPAITEEVEQDVEVAIGDRPAEGLDGQRGNNLPGTACFLGEARGVTAEDALAARPRGGRHVVVGHFDEYLADVRVEGVAGNRTGRVHGAGKGLVESGVRQVTGGQEGDTHAVEAGLDRDRWRATTITTLVADLLVPVVEV